MKVCNQMQTGVNRVIQQEYLFMIRKKKQNI